MLHVMSLPVDNRERDKKKTNFVATYGKTSYFTFERGEGGKKISWTLPLVDFGICSDLYALIGSNHDTTT